MLSCITAKFGKWLICIIAHIMKVGSCESSGKRNNKSRKWELGIVDRGGYIRAKGCHGN